MSVEIRRVTAAETVPLRQEVLRPHESVQDLLRAHQGQEHAVFFAAVEDEQVIGTAWVQPEATPWPSDHLPAWRLRGMATAQKRRGKGIGAAVLGAVMDHVRREGGGLLWCNARVPAIAFYRRAGFVTRGGSWEDPAIGPHIAMQVLI